MTNLFRHPRTGIYSVRRVVPVELRPIVGKTAIKRTLGTRDLAEAKVKAKPIGIEIDQMLARAREGFQWPSLELIEEHYLPEFFR
jgi:hypothetical protein